MNDLVVAPIELEEATDSVTGSGALFHRDLSMLGHVNVKLDVHLGNAEVSVDRLFSMAKGKPWCWMPRSMRRSSCNWMASRSHGDSSWP